MVGPATPEPETAASASSRRRTRADASGLHDHPAPTLELGSERLVGDRLQATVGCDRRRRGWRALEFGLEPADESVRLIARELPSGLALRQAERAAGVAEPVVSGGGEQFE